MTRVVYSRRARREIVHVVEGIAADNPSAARAFENDLSRHISLLAGSPEMGRLRPDVGSAIRSLTHGNYLIFYHYARAADRVDILCVRHGRRRLPQLET
jgi:toxin ParE1/3/4